MNPNIQIESIHAAGYLNLISQKMKDMKISQTIDEKAPVSCQSGRSGADDRHGHVNGSINAGSHGRMGQTPGRRKITASPCASLIL